MNGSIAQQKIYLVALCLQAATVLAETPEGEAVEQKQLLQQILDAVKNPSSEHFTIYLGIGVVLAIVAGIVFTAFGPKEETQIISMDDLGTVEVNRTKKTGDGKSKKKSKVVEQETKKPKKKAKGEEDWSDQEGLDIDDLHKDLDQGGPWVTTGHGTLDLNSMVSFKKIVGKHTYLAYRQRKEEVMLERIEHFKARRLQEYGQCIVMAAQEFQKLMIETTQAAAEFIDLDESNFAASMQEAMADAATVEQFKKNDEGVRLLVEVPEEMSIDKARAILVEKFELEQMSEQKLRTIPRPTNQAEAGKIQAIVMIEKTQVMDRLFIKHNVRMADILHAERKYNLATDPEINAMKNAHKQQREMATKGKQEAQKKNLLEAVTPEQTAEIKAMIESMGEIDLTMGIDGKLKIDEFWKVFEIMVTMQIRQAHRITHDKAAERRGLMKADKKKEYAELLQATLQMLQKSKGSVHVATLHIIGMDADSYQKSTKAIGESPQMETKAKEIMGRIEVDERSAQMGDDYKVMTREVALEKIQKIEDKKSDFVAGIMVLAQLGKYPKEQMGVGQEMAKFQALDTLHEELEIQEGDIIIAFNKYALGDDEEFGAIIRAAQLSTKEKFESTMQKLKAEQVTKYRAAMAADKAAADAKAAAAGNLPPRRVFGEGTTAPDGQKAEDLGW